MSVGARVSIFFSWISLADSDAFSSLSANPSLGKAVDILVSHGGTAILSETPEIYGVENSLTAIRRMFMMIIMQIMP